MSERIEPSDESILATSCTYSGLVRFFISFCELSREVTAGLYFVRFILFKGRRSRFFTMEDLNEEPKSYLLNRGMLLESVEEIRGGNMGDNKASERVQKNYKYVL
jgi:hypothetical protein